MPLISRRGFGLALCGLILLSFGFLGYAQADTTTSLSPDLNPSVFGQLVTFTAAVQVVSGTQTPSGTVTFYDGAVNLGATPLNASYQATLDTSTLTVGLHDITAKYNEDPDTNASTSDSLYQTVNKASITISIDPQIDPEPSTVGGAYDVSVTLQVEDPPGAGTPTGTITVDDGENSVSAAAAAVVILNLTSTSAGHKLLTATYSGDGSFEGATTTAEHDVNKGDTIVSITSDTPDSSFVGEQYVVSGEVSSVSGTPGGTVTVDDGEGQSCTSEVSTGSWSCTLVSLVAGSKTLTATYSGDENFNTDTDATELHGVNKGVVVISTSDTGTPSGFTDTPATSLVGVQYTVSGYVLKSTGVGTPSGTVTVDDGDGQSCVSDVESDGSWSCTLTSFTAIVGTDNLTATYSGDSNFNTASETESHNVNERATKTTIMGSDTALVVNDTATFTVTVTDTSPGTPSIPTGNVTISVSPNEGDMPSPITRTLDDAGEATFPYTPSSATTPTHTFTVSYAGDSIHTAAPDADLIQQIIKRTLTVQLICTPIEAFIGQPINCQIIIADATTAGTFVLPDKDLYFTLSDDRWGNLISLRVGAITWQTNGGSLIGTFTYTPAAWDTAASQLGTPSSGAQPQAVATITASYAGSPVHVDNSTEHPLTITLRPTQTKVECSYATLLVRQKYSSCKVTVTDMAGVGTATAFAGTLDISTSEPEGEVKINNFLLNGLPNPEITFTVASGDPVVTSFSYERMRLNADAGFDLVRADYAAADGIHADSAGAFAQGLSRRPTVTYLTGTSTSTGADGCVDVYEDSNNAGTETTITGKMISHEPVDPFDAGAGTHEVDVFGCTGMSIIPSDSHSDCDCGVTLVTNILIANIAVQFVADDTVGIHLSSSATTMVDRSGEFTPDPEDPPDTPTPHTQPSPACDGGCGEDGVDIDQMIYDLNASDVALAAVQMGLEGLAIVADFLPDLIIGGGVFAITGVTIPISDIASAILAGSGIALEIARIVMTTDLDGDGLPDVVENTVTGTDNTKTDTDGDGLGDYDEISEAGGFYGGSRRPNPNYADSDGDGLSDGDESGFYNTSFCVPDTDCDWLTDGQEVATWDLTDLRYHLDPLMEDTDGDGISDYIEYYVEHSPCPYGNAPDSDGDGLIDGYEDKSLDGCWGDFTTGIAPGDTGYCGADEITIGDSAGPATKGTATYWETNLCDPDTDHDGLSDGEEEGLLGVGLTGAVSPSGTVSTVPALDDDCDDDGLSDYEEVNITGTNPLHWDTDGDYISDANELIAKTVVGPVGLGFRYRSFQQESDPLDPDTDDDGLNDYIEYGNTGAGTGLGTTRTTGGTRDTTCPYVNDDDSDDDGLQDGYEDDNHDGVVDTTDHDGIWNNYTLPANGSTGQGSGETNPCDLDTDNDGLSDGEEAGLFVPVPPPFLGSMVVSTTAGDTVPALDDDSDNDGLSDYEEVNITGTDPLDSDTDNDNISDANELIATGTWPKRAFQQESDPLDPDTDDDLLQDDMEYRGTAFEGTGLGITRIAGGTPDNICPFVNDDDSDDDGLQDGYEDDNHDGVVDTTDHDGIWNNYAIGNSGSQGSGETNPCDPDTDNDGLSDGEEAGLFVPVPPPFLGSMVVSTTAGDTVPALDDDSDNDGLSDYEEVNVTGTDPLDADTDDDGLLDSWELIVTAGDFPYRSFYQESDPLDPDTDDDGIRDDVEYNDGNGSGVDENSTVGSNPGNADSTCPYVNDDDSDDDGLQDGTEGWLTRDITITYILGHTGTQSGRTAQDDGLVGETDFCDPDTDGDGLTDGEEFALFGGLVAEPDDWHPSAGTEPAFEMVEAVDPSGTVISTIPALDDDCDDDGLSDYEEVNVTGTDPLDADTDDDGLLDSWELIVIAGDFPYRSFYQESDPLDPDTDDDGIRDDVEYNDKAGSGVGRDHGLTSGLYGYRDATCPFVNDDDSDDDGLQDGTEDANHDGAWGIKGSGGITVGQMSDGSQASKPGQDYWETDLCNPDTDGDGLLDGEEVSLIGGAPTMPGGGFDPQNPLTRLWPGFYIVNPEGRSTEYPDGPNYTGGLNPPPLYTFTPMPGGSIDPTIPALDVDSDNDGLSDYEEVNITGTDPLDADSDNDTIMDADELIATGGLEDTPGNPGIGPRRTFDQESNPLDINTDNDYLFDPVEGACADPIYVGTGLSALQGQAGGTRDTDCPYVNNADSDDDGLQDGLVVYVNPQTSIGYDYSYTHFEDFRDVTAYLGPEGIDSPGFAKVTVDPPTDGEQYNDAICNVCDSDSDGDGLLDGEEVSIGTNPDDWDTDNDGRSDWHEHTGGGPIPTDPFDPDTDDDGLTDSVEVFGDNPTNPVNADTDGDGLCDGGTGTPWMTSTDTRVIVNPICKSCAVPGLDDCGATGGVRTGSVDGIGDHPNPHGYGEDKDGDGTWDGSIGDEWGDGEPGSPETDPNQYDTDGDAEGDGIEVLGFSTSRQYMIPPADLFGHPITVIYPACGCLEPLILDTDGDGLTDGYEDNNHDGNFDFLPSDFDYAPDPLPGPPQPNPNETNPCDPDTDHDELTDWEERNQRQPLLAYPVLPLDNDGDGLIDEDPVDGIDNDLDGLIDEDSPEGPIELTFNPTNPLDHDTDNDRLLDGEEVYWVCVAVTYTQLDNDGDALIDEDPVDGLDNDGDGLFDEDPVDFFVRFVQMLDPTCRDSDSDGFIDGLDDDPCNSELIPLLQPVQMQPIDTDGDGFADDDEIVAGTHPNDPEDYPTAYCMIDLDFDQEIDDRLWLEPTLCCGIANSVAIDIDSNVLIDARVRIIAPRDVKKGDFDGDGSEDDYRYVVEYAFGNYRVVQPRIVLTIDDYNGDLVIDHAEVVKK